jgi:hypothetical protein
MKQTCHWHEMEDANTPLQVDLCVCMCLVSFGGEGLRTSMPGSADACTAGGRVAGVAKMIGAGASSLKSLRHL